MLKKALKISLVISIIAIILLAGAAYLTREVKKEVKKAETTVPDKVEYSEPAFISSEEMSKRVVKKMGKKKAGIYSERYGKAALKVIEKLKKKEKYTVDKPLLIVNPFGTNTTGLYIYFRHSYRVNTKYTVSVKGETESVMYTDFSAPLYTNTSGMPLAEQEGQIIGLIPGMKNYVSVYLYDENNKMIAKAGYKIDIPETDSGIIKKLDIVQDREVSQLSSGLYCVLGLNAKADKGMRRIFFYDNNGVIRAIVPLKKELENEDINLKTVDGKLFYAIDERRYALVNGLGRPEKIYDIGKDYEPYGDFDLNAVSRKMVTFAKKGKGKKNSALILSLDVYTGKTKELASFKELLKGYYKKGEKEPILSSVQFINDNDIIVSEASTSSIMRINNVMRRPEVKMIISGSSAFSGTEYEKLLYMKDGDFTTQSSQSTAYIDKNEQVSKRQYHIAVFNTGNADTSSYYKYLVDEGEKKYKLTERIDIPHSEKGGNAVMNGEFLIIASSGAGTFEEYNSDGNRLARFSVPNGGAFYRVIKNDMKGSWFAK